MAGCLDRQSDQDLPMTVFKLTANKYFSAGMRHFTTEVFQVTWSRFNSDHREAGRFAFNPQYSSEKFDIGTCTPVMTIRTGFVDIRNFRPGGHAHLDIIPPYSEPVQIFVTESGFHECLVRLGLKSEAGLFEPQLRLANAIADVSISSSCFCRRGM